MTGQSTPDLIEKLAAIEVELMFQTGCRAEEIAGVYRKPIAKPVVNARMGEALRARFAAENERDALRDLLKISIDQTADARADEKYVRAQNAELLAALEPFADAMGHNLETVDDNVSVALFFKSQLFKKAKTAVAKAKGEK